MDSSNSTYAYRPLSLEQDATRLLELLPASNIHDPLLGRIKNVRHSKHRYIALSYVWGNPNLSENIEIEGEALPISKSLSIFLRNIRPTNGIMTLWVDAICINQTDLRERNSQVQQMRSIFMNADRVVGWLGGSTPRAKAAFQLLDDLLEQLNTKAWPMFIKTYISDESNHQILHDLSELLDSEFWRRVWIIQEVTINDQTYLAYDADTQNWFPVRKLLNVWEVRAKIGSAARESGIDTVWNVSLSKFDNVGQTMTMRKMFPLAPMELLPCLQKFIQGVTTATNPVDVIYGIMGLFETTLVPIDYSLAPRELYLDVVRIVQHQTGKLDFLSAAWPALQEESPDRISNVHKLPTWGVDWSYRTRGLGIIQLATSNPGIQQRLRGKTVYSASGDSSQIITFDRTSDIIMVKGNLIATISSLGSVFDREASTHAWCKDWVDLAGLPNLQTPNQTSISEMTDGRLDGWYLSSDKSDTELLSQWWEALTADLSRQTARLENWGVAGLACPPRNRDDLRALLVFFSSSSGWSIYNGRRMCRTASHRLGLAPARASQGDLVCRFFGGDVLYVLRESTRLPGCYEYIGECFVNGLMDFASVEQDSPETTFNIC